MKVFGRVMMAVPLAVALFMAGCGKKQEEGAQQGEMAPPATEQSAPVTAPETGGGMEGGEGGDMGAPAGEAQ